GLKVLARREALAEALGLAQACGDRRIERFARLVMARVVREQLGPHRPHLVDLARELDEVAEDVGAREARVARVREESVERVPELVEERLDLVEREERRLARGGARHVEVV